MLVDEKKLASEYKKYIAQFNKAVQKHLDFPPNLKEILDELRTIILQGKTPAAIQMKSYVDSLHSCIQAIDEKEKSTATSKTSSKSPKTTSKKSSTSTPTSTSTSSQCKRAAESSPASSGDETSDDDDEEQQVPKRSRLDTSWNPMTQEMLLSALKDLLAKWLEEMKNELKNELKPLMEKLEAVAVQQAEASHKPARKNDIHWLGLHAFMKSDMVNFKFFKDIHKTDGVAKFMEKYNAQNNAFTFNSQAEAIEYGVTNNSQIETAASNIRSNIARSLRKEFHSRNPDFEPSWKPSKSIDKSTPNYERTLDEYKVKWIGEINEHFGFVVLSDEWWELVFRLAKVVYEDLYKRFPSSSDLAWAGFVLRTYWDGGLLNEDGGKDIHPRFADFQSLTKQKVETLLA